RGGTFFLVRPRKKAKKSPGIGFALSKPAHPHGLLKSKRDIPGSAVSTPLVAHAKALPEASCFALRKPGRTTGFRQGETGWRHFLCLLSLVAKKVEAPPARGDYQRKKASAARAKTARFCEPDFPASARTKNVHPGLRPKNN
ncbi:hypothetical protein, partial [uncultured Rikenella sp.]|uniref:hypothetical protein n=1 Tax=uncultured Rikenella sp. TaxID=368003 RepID=UPI00260B4806